MKVVILAGGYGTRLSEETHLKPKPMVEIGGMPILWHIIKMYSTYGIKEFVICCGYKGYIIKEYFSNYFLHMSNVTFDMSDNKMLIHKKNVEDWKITLVDTGQNTMTGGRLKRVEEFINNETFGFTYGDGLSDVNIDSLIKSHKASNKLATITAVQPKGRYGSLLIEGHNEVVGFQEKVAGDGGWVNGGFFILEPEVLNLIKDDQTTWEQEPLNELANKNQLNAFKHNGFWQPMDTLREKNQLQEMWDRNEAPWKLW